jgi:hypothetical protein
VSDKKLQEIYFKNQTSSYKDIAKETFNLEKKGGLRYQWSSTFYTQRPDRKLLKENS